MPITTMTHPLFSIITVCYNAADTIVPTLRSVAKQSFTLYEHLVIDGASMDDTLARVDKYATPRTRVFSEPDNGIYDAMNKGMGQATGDYLIFLNAGDSFASSDTLQILADAILFRACRLLSDCVRPERVGDNFTVDKMGKAWYHNTCL